MRRRTVLEYAIDHEIPCDALTIKQQAEELEQLRGECGALREALTTIKTQYGQVCEEFMTCNHPACTSSYSCWATADEALASSPLSEKYAAVVSAALRVRRNQIEGQRFCTTATYGGNQEEWKRLADEELEGVLAWENAIDALQEATK